MMAQDSDVVILKPTAVFLNFLAKHFPHSELPDLATLKSDSTAYTIIRQDTDEDTLNEIERHFPFMFKHEIYRAIGQHVEHDLEVSFLDFLCCFKFELHSQIVLLEGSLNQGQQLLRVKPRSVLLTWMKTSCDDQIDLSEIFKQMNITHLTENATVLVKNFNSNQEIKPFVQNYYRPIFKAEMLRICDAAQTWPEVDSFETFNRYFAVELHSQLVHLH
jgi:hypothetical protein